MKDSKTYTKYLDEKLGLALEHLSSLVHINSQTTNIPGINKVGQKCIDIFGSLGFKAQVIPSQLPEPYGDYVFLSHLGKQKKNIVFVSHLDTVFSEKEEKENDFFWREEKDKIYGPGVADIKGGTILIYMILDALKAVDPDFFYEYTWQIFLNAREEEGTDEFHLIAKEYFTPETLAILVYEAGEIEEVGSSIVDSRKGVARFFMKTIGRQAHSGTCHHKGANAILELAQKVIEIEQHTNYDRGLTFNVGTISGGTAINRIPDYAECYIDIRTKTKQDYDYAVKFIQNYDGKGIVKSQTGDFLCKTVVEQLPSYPCWPQNEASKKLAQVFINSAEELGLVLKSKARSGASDACFFWSEIPTVDGLGPLGANDHCSIQNLEEGKEQEFILKSSLCERALLNIMAVYKIMQSELL